MSDTAMQSTDTLEATPAQKRRRKASVQNGIPDLEIQARDVVPVDPVPSARKNSGTINVGRPERLVTIIGGAALVAYGITRRGWGGLAMAATGGCIALRGILGHCPVYQALDANIAPGESRETTGIHVEQSITIDSSREELYGFWRDFENQALISDYLSSVKVTGPITSHWIAEGPANKRLEWDAEVINDVPNELIAWKTLPGSDIEHAGSVRFMPVPDGRGTEVHVTMQYYPPAGTLGAGVALLFHREPSIQAADTLKRLKSLMETGDIIQP